MTRRHSNPRTSFFGLSFLGGIFILLIAYALILFVGGLLSYVVYPTPLRFGVYYGMVAGLTFMALGRCIASDLEWALPAAVRASGANILLLALMGVSSTLHYYNGKTPSLSSAAIFFVMAAVSAVVTLLLVRQTQARRQLRQRDQRDAGPY